MPIPYYRTAKGRAERHIRQNAHNWLTITDVETATGLPRRAIRDAMEELRINNVLIRSGEFGNGKHYRYADWMLKRLDEKSANGTTNVAKPDTTPDAPH